MTCILIGFSTLVSTSAAAGDTARAHMEEQQPGEPIDDNWIEFDGSLSGSTTGEAATGEATDWVGADVTALMSLRLTDWHRDDCAPFCGALWTNTYGARVDVFARGFATSDSGGPAALDLQIDQSAELAVWLFSIEQNFTYQQEATFYQTYWRPHRDTMGNGFVFKTNILSAVDSRGGIEVAAMEFGYRVLSISDEDDSPHELSFDVALIDAVAATGVTWFERFALGVVDADLYEVPVRREGRTRVTEQTTALTFDFAVLNGLRLWDAPWRIDATLGGAGLSPIAEVRRTPVLEGGEVVDTDYSGGPSVITPHLWFGVHHASNRSDYLLTPSVIFESIPNDADFGFGAGSFHRIDGSGFAVDAGAQAAAYARLQLAPNFMLRSEILGIVANRRVVSNLSDPLPIEADETFMMGRAEAGVIWAFSDHWLLSADAWIERSDRETHLDESQAGLGNRFGVKAGLVLDF